MATYKIIGEVTVSAITEIEADSEEEALEIAASYDVSYASICDISYKEDFFVTDIDGEVVNMRVENVQP